MAIISDIVLGGGAFNEQYNDDIENVPVKELIQHAMAHGITAIDTSPYYGPSEILIGKALSSFTWDRQQLNICTKVGRVAEDEFNYSREHVRFSVMRSLERLLGGSFKADSDKKNWYLDIMYLHDVEFQPIANCLEALHELRALQQEGFIRRVGISGYPLEYLYELAHRCKNDPTIGSLDCILSYCNLNLQNTKLLDFEDKLRTECGIPLISNASVLSMSLLRAQETRSWHPSSPELQTCADQAAKYCESKDFDLADIAVRYALSKWTRMGPTVIGCSNILELNHALGNSRLLKQRSSNCQLDVTEQEIVAHIQNEIFASHMNEKWESGINHPELHNS